MTTKTFEQAAEEVRNVMEAAYEEHDNLWLAGCVWRNDLEDYQVVEPEKNIYLTLDEDTFGIYKDEKGNWFMTGDSYAEMRSEYYQDKGKEFIQQTYPELNEVELMEAALQLGWKN